MKMPKIEIEPRHLDPTPRHPDGTIDDGYTFDLTDWPMYQKHQAPNDKKPPKSGGTTRAS